MASIESSIRLHDYFSNAMYNIVESVNAGRTAIDAAQETMNQPVDATAFDSVTEQIEEATAAAQVLNDALQEVHAPTIDVPMLPVPSGFDPNRNPPPVTPLLPPPAPPIPQPVQWQTDNQEVFMNTGVERFQQEVASVNAKLQQLSSIQDSIANQAASTTIFSPEATQDLSNLAVRIDGVRMKIQQVESNSMNIGTDHANSELEQLRTQLNQAVQDQNDLNSAMQRMDVGGANAAYVKLSQSVGNTERYIRDNVSEQGRFNQEIRAGTNAASGLQGQIARVAAAYLTFQTGGKVLGLSDELTQTTARLNLMNDGMQSTEDLQNQLFLSAERSRTSYMATADVVAKLGQRAPDAFGSNQETIQFAENLNKQFVIAGASQSEISSASLQLTQALGSGVLRGEELNAVFEAAPNVIQTIADHLGVPIGQIKEMASNGEISADIVKNAMLGATDDINAQFETIPMTWGQIANSIKNNAVMAFQPVLQRMNDIANSEAFQSFVSGLIDSMAVLANVVLSVFEMIGTIGTFIVENWSIIAPILGGVATAMLLYNGYLIAHNIIMGITNTLEAISVAKTAIKTGLTLGQAAATSTATGAQVGLNAALLACPLTWIIILVIAIIAIFYAVVAAINHFAGTSISATGIIVGVLATAGAFIGNLFVVLINMVIDIFVVLWNFIASFANFFANVFTDPVGSIARLFFDLVDTVLSLLQSLASAIDTIFGSSLASSVSGWRDDLGGWVDDTFGQGEEIMAKISGESLHVNRFDYTDSFKAGYSVGEGIENKIANFSLEDLFGKVDIPDPEDYETGAYSPVDGTGGAGGGVGDDVSDIASNTGDMADSMDITNEDLKYLRDIAEQEVINRFTTAEIVINQTNNNKVASDTDVDGMISNLTDGVNEAMEQAAEGVHI